MTFLHIINLCSLLLAIWVSFNSCACACFFIEFCGFVLELDYGV
jgi:hypothetical protein